MHCPSQQLSDVRVGDWPDDLDYSTTPGKNENFAVGWKEGKGKGN